MKLGKNISSLFLGFVLVICFGGSAWAQPCYGGSCYGGSGIPSNEIGVRLGHLSDGSTIGGVYSSKHETFLGFLNGLHYKRYQSNGAFRTQFGYNQYNIDELSSGPSPFKTEGKVEQIMLKMGYEVFTFIGPFEPFIGLDFAVGLGKYDGKTYTYGINHAEFMEYTDQRTRRGFGFAPVAGLRCYLGPYLSLGAETTFEAMLYNRGTNISDLNLENPSIQSQRNSWEGTYHPVSWLSLNVLF